MEKIHTICVMRDVVRAMSKLESQLMNLCSLTLNEAMVLCCIANEAITASEICEYTLLQPSHASKVIRHLEDKGFLLRATGKEDKRTMIFSLTNQGKTIIDTLKAHPLDIPETLMPLFADK